MRKSNYHSLYYSSLVHSLIHFSHPSFCSRQDCEYLYSLALYLLMEIETEETFYGRDKRGKCDVFFFFSLIRDNDYLAPRNRKIKEKNLVQHVERTF